MVFNEMLRQETDETDEDILAAARMAVALDGAFLEVQYVEHEEAIEQLLALPLETMVRTHTLVYLLHAAEQMGDLGLGKRHLRLAQLHNREIGCTNHIAHDGSLKGERLLHNQAGPAIVSAGIQNGQREAGRVDVHIATAQCETMVAMEQRQLSLEHQREGVAVERVAHAIHLHGPLAVRLEKTHLAALHQGLVQAHHAGQEFRESIHILRYIIQSFAGKGKHKKWIMFRFGQKNIIHGFEYL